MPHATCLCIPGDEWQVVFNNFSKSKRSGVWISDDMVVLSTILLCVGIYKFRDCCEHKSFYMRTYT